MIKIFIFGMQRSGTSILSSVLGELPDSYHYPEVGADINSEQFKEGGQTIRLKSLEEVETQKTEYIYNGGKLDVSFFSLSFSHDYCSRVAHGYFFLDGQAFSLTLLFPSSLSE